MNGFEKKSPKNLQLKGDFDAAAVGFANRYLDALHNGDEFMRNHYLDELAHTIILKSSGREAISTAHVGRPNTRMNSDRLNATLMGTLKDIVHQRGLDWKRVERDLAEDLQLTRLKWYPALERGLEKEEKNL